jgi:hypothetical protein
MSFGEIWSVALGTALALGMVLALFVIRKLLRGRFFPGESTSVREKALTDLLLLQARMESQLSGRSRLATEVTLSALETGEESTEENGSRRGSAEAKDHEGGAGEVLRGGRSTDGESDADRSG